MHIELTEKSDFKMNNFNVIHDTLCLEIFINKSSGYKNMNDIFKNFSTNLSDEN